MIAVDINYRNSPQSRRGAKDGKDKEEERITEDTHGKAGGQCHQLP